MIAASLLNGLSAPALNGFYNSPSGVLMTRHAARCLTAPLTARHLFSTKSRVEIRYVNSSRSSIPSDTYLRSCLRLSAFRTNLPSKVATRYLYLAPPPRSPTRYLSTHSPAHSGLVSFNHHRVKNVSYFRGKNPWRNVSRGPSKPDPSAAKPTGDPPRDTRHLLERLPDLSHRLSRPTKADLLAAATGFWSRLRVHFKWFSIRSLRPFNLDDISAFFSWFLLGHVIWILVGTTTFFSILVFTVNTVFAQETLAGWVGNYLTKSSGVQVAFESAIVPRWKDGVISFKNVYVSRRPGQHQAKVSKVSQSSAKAAAAAAALSEKPAEDRAVEEEDGNYTQYDVSIDTVNVTLSFVRWFNGKGLLRDVEIKGIRGVMDRTSVHWGEGIDPRTYRHEHSTGDFELESFKMEDLLLTVDQPGSSRPFSVSVFSADLPRLRKQWLFYDFLAANHVSGSFDDSPFFIHPRQTHSNTGALLHNSTLDSAGGGQWKKQSRIRVDGLDIAHLNRGVAGPFSWIHKGNVDVIADIMFPVDDDESLSKVVTDFYNHVEASVTSNRYLQQADPQLELATDNHSRSTVSHSGEPRSPIVTNSQQSEPGVPPLILDLRLQLNDVHAMVPLFTRDLSYVNNALIRPIVAYINSRKTFIPVNCRVVKSIGEFDGSWTIYDSGLMEETSQEVYEAFARDVGDNQKTGRRMKKVGLWSLKLVVEALFLGLAGNMALG